MTARQSAHRLIATLARPLLPTPTHNHFDEAAEAVALPGDNVLPDAPDDWTPELCVDGQPCVVLSRSERYAHVRFVVRVGGMWRPTGQYTLAARSETREWVE